MKTENKFLAKNLIVATGLKPQTRKWVSIYGASGAGKSRLALALARKIWEKDTSRNILIIDTENRAQYSIVRELADAYTNGKVIISDVSIKHTITDFYAGLSNMVKEYKPSCIIIDSFSFIGGLHSAELGQPSLKDTNDYTDSLSRNKFRDYSGTRLCEEVTFNLLKSFEADIILVGLSTSSFKQVKTDTGEKVVNLIEAGLIEEINFLDCKKAIGLVDFAYFLISHKHCIVRKNSMEDFLERREIKDFSIESIKYLYDGSLEDYLKIEENRAPKTLELLEELEKANTLSELQNIGNAIKKEKSLLTANDEIFLREAYVKCKNKIMSEVPNQKSCEVETDSMPYNEF